MRNWGELKGSGRIKGVRGESKGLGTVSGSFHISHSDLSKFPAIGISKQLYYSLAVFARNDVFGLRGACCV